jgi:anti-sigma factor RsiW
VTQEYHERAKGLVATARVEGISDNEREWLEHHLQGCPECAAFAGEMEHALRSLQQISVRVDPELVARTRRAVHLCAHEMSARQSQWFPLWVSCAISWVLGGITLPWVWRGIEWVGQYINLPSPVGILILIVWWALPTLAVAALVGPKGSQAAGE